MEKATVWQEERAPGRQHQQQQGRACPYRTVLGPGHGERGCPSPRHVSEYPEVEERQGALEQTDSTVPARLWALSPEAMVQAAVSSLEGSCGPQAPFTAQRVCPPSIQASSIGKRRTQTQAL